MALPISTAINTLDFGFDGQPFVQSSSKSSQSTQTLDFAFEGQPFVAASLMSNTICSIEQTEVITLLDSSSYTYTDSPRELVSLLDQGSATDGTNQESQSLNESVSFTYYLSFEEVLNATDSSSDAVATLEEEFDLYFGSIVGIGSAFNQHFSSKAGVQVFDDLLLSIQLNVIADNFPFSTNLTSVSNPFTPTIIVDGVDVVSNPGTYPSNTITSAVSLYINIAGAGLDSTPAEACDLFAYSFTLNQLGGNFNVSSVIKMGALAAELKFFDLSAAITNLGKVLSNSQAGFTHSGIFGPVLMHRRFEYLIGGSAFLRNLIVGPSYSNLPSANWQTAATIAGAATTAAGARINWAIPDFMVPDFKLDISSNALNTLSDLAGRGGGILRWKGRNEYDVVYPDFGYKQFVIPSCKLILSDGIKEECFYDLETGNLSNPIIISDPDYGDSGIKVIVPGTQDQPKGEQKQYQQLAKISKKLTVDDPPAVYDLPYDYDQVLIQILVNDVGETGGNNLATIENFITRDPHQFFDYNVGDFGTEYLFVTNIGGVLQPQIMVDYRIFTVDGTNSTIDSNNFILTLAATRKSLGSLLEEDKVAEETKQEAVLKNTQDKFRFIRQCEWTISFIFFGVLPMPGMGFKYIASGIKVFRPTSPIASETILLEDIVIEGIIDTVSFSFPGYVTITVIKYKKLKFHESARIQYIGEV